MAATRSVPPQRGRRFLVSVCVAVLCAAAPAFAQSPPSGFDSVPRPPGSIPSQSLVPPGGGSVLAPPATPSSPLQLAPPAAQPVALPPPPANPAPAAPPAGAAPQA